MKTISKKISMILSTAAIAATVSFPAFAASPGIGRTQSVAQPDQQTIAQLQQAEQTARRDGRNGNKNNPEFGRKASEIDQLIDRMQSGQQVDPAEIDKALEPAHVW